MDAENPSQRDITTPSDATECDGCGCKLKRGDTLTLVGYFFCAVCGAEGALSMLRPRRERGPLSPSETENAAEVLVVAAMRLQFQRLDELRKARS